MNGVFADLKFALRMVRRSPGLTAAAILALALGIGANTAIFSVVDGVLLRPLPYPDPHALYAINVGSKSRPGQFGPFSYPDFLDLQKEKRALSDVGAWADGDANLVNNGAAPERVLTHLATPSVLTTLGVQPMLGRNFLPEEALKGNDHVAIVDYGLWQRQLGGKADAIGRSLRIDNVDYKVVGVLPRGFRFGRPADVWMPMSTGLPFSDFRNAHFLRVIGRRAPGASEKAVFEDVEGFGQRLVQTWSDIHPANSGWGTVARPYHDVVVGEVRVALFVLFGAVAFVLLIACANVANLLLARAATRTREMAVRTALGAGRMRLVRQLLTESLLLSIVGGALGVVFASWGIDVLLGLAPDTLPRSGDIGLDARVLLFTSGVALLTGVAFGVVPALVASRPDLHDALKDGARGATSGRGRMRKTLVVVEVALSLVLLVGAGLMVRSFLRLRAVDPGFRPEGALMLKVSLPVPDNIVGEPEKDRFVSYFTRAAERLRQLPGVTAAGAGSILPLDGSTDRLFEIEGYVPVDKADRPDAENRDVTPGFFEAIGITLDRGRFFGEGDSKDAPPVAIVNEAMVRKYFSSRGRDALGKRIRMGAGPKDPGQWATIVGVIGDVRSYGLDQPAQPEMYFPTAQARTSSAMALIMRTKGDPAALAQSARAAMAEVDAQQPIFDLKPLEALVSESLGQRRFTLTLMLLFGLVALILAAVGIYGVMAYGVAQRTQEIGVRMALGARPRTVLAMVLKDGMKLVALGLVIGTAAALALARVAASLLWGVSATDAGTYVAVGAVLSAVAFVAIVIPARRATRVDPMQALRSE